MKKDGEHRKSTGCISTSNAHSLLSLSQVQGHQLNSSHKNVTASMRSLVLQQLEFSSSFEVTQENYAHQRNLDKGYSWVILVSCAILQCVAYSTPISSGIFYAILREEYVEHKTVLAWCYSLQASLTCSVAPLGAILIEKTSAKCIAMIGCVGTGLSLALISFTTNIELIYLGIILSGLFSSMTYLPACTHAIHYFHKYRVFALALVTSALPLGFLFIPPITTELTELYGWRESNLFLAFLNLQAAVLVMLLRDQPKVTNQSLSDSQRGEITDYNSDTSNPTQSNEFTSKHSIVVVDAINKDETGEAEKMVDSNISPHTTETNSLPDREVGFFQTMFHWRMYVMIGLCLIWGWSNAYYVLFPEYVQQNGLTPEQTSISLVVGGVASFLTRIFIGVTGQFVKYNKVLAMIGGQLFMAVGLTSSALAYTFPWLTLSLVLYAIGFSLHACLQNAVNLEMHGEYKITRAFSLQLLLLGVGSTCSVPFAGLFESEENSFYISSGLCVLSGLLYVPHVLLTYKHGRR